MNLENFLTYFIAAVVIVTVAVLLFFTSAYLMGTWLGIVIHHIK